MNLGVKKGFSIFSRLLITLLGVVVLISGVLTTVFYVYNKRSLEKQTSENILQQFETISYHFRYELRDALVKELQLLSSNPILDEFLMSSEAEREINGRAVERFFLESLKYSRGYESIAFADYAGREVIKVNWSGRVRTYRDLGRQPFFEKIRNGQPGQIEVDSPRKDRFGTLIFSAGISKTDADSGKFGGAVIIGHSFDDFIDYLDRIKIMNENPIWLLTPDGTVVKQPSEDRALLDPRPSFSKGFQKEPALSMTDGGMVVYQDLYVSPDQPLFRLAIGIPASFLLQDIRAVLRFFLIVFLAALIVISVLAYSLAGYLSRPIVELAHAASRLARGDGSTRVRVAATGEVQMLVDSFNLMAADIQRTTVSKNYMDNIIGSMMNTLIVISLDGRIERTNAAACFLLEYEEAELQGQAIDRVIVDEPGEEEMTLSAVVAKGSISAIEKNYLTKSGKKVPVLFSASVIRDALNIVQGVVCVAQDITERKRAEARLQAYSAELQEINEELKNFSYIVSHDLRAPLVNIKGFSEELNLGIKAISPLLEKYLEGLGEAKRRKYGEVLKKDIPEALTFIGSSVDRMDNLIHAVLKLSRVERRMLNPEPIGTQAMVQSVLNSLAHQIGNRHILVETKELPDVVADRTAFEQIIGNLLDNAIKYLEPERPGRIEITAEQNVRETIFRIHDNGRGMTKEDIPKAFEIFRRVGRQDVSGEGMGLAYVKTLVRLQGGHIWCDSEPGVGTTFSFTVPRSDATTG